MHIPEGMLPLSQALGWSGASGLVLAKSVIEFKKTEKKLPQLLPLMGILGAAVFVLSMLHIPVPFTGTSAHMVGVPLAALLVGPWLSIILALSALILQALLLGEGSIGTLGANLFAMGVAGSFTAWYVFLAVRKLRLSDTAAVFTAACLGDLAVYVVSAVQLAPVFPGESLTARLSVLLLAFLPLQFPVAVLEGFVTAGIYRLVEKQRPGLIEKIKGKQGNTHA